jgi:putative ABC transport system permease protein
LVSALARRYWQHRDRVGERITLGMGAALVLTRLMVGLVFGVKTYDPGVFAGVAALLSVVAMIAALLPAWRATGIDPLEAVRGT